MAWFLVLKTLSTGAGILLEGASVVINRSIAVCMGGSQALGYTGTWVLVFPGEVDPMPMRLTEPFVAGKRRVSAAHPRPPAPLVPSPAQWRSQRVTTFGKIRHISILEPVRFRSISRTGAAGFKSLPPFHVSFSSLQPQS